MILGLVFSIWFNNELKPLNEWQVTCEMVLCGLVSGLASTGLYELFDNLIHVNNCKAAILEAAKGKKKRSYVKEILQYLDFYAVDLSYRLQTDNFLTPYKPKTIVDGLSHKEREILVPKFYPDQCAHHAIIRVIQPYIYNSTYKYSCANIKGRGIDYAAKYMAKCMKVPEITYCAKSDISKFYSSVDNELLKKSFRTKFKDEKLLHLLDIIVDSAKGLPIGNYTSPWFAEFYLRKLDTFIKQDLKIKYYCRYADDIVFMGTNCRKMIYQQKEINKFIKKELNLEIKSNYQVFPIYDKGHGRKIDFVGRCFGKGFCTIRKRIALALMRQSRLIQKLKKKGKEISFKNACGFISRTAIFKHTNSLGMRKKYQDCINIKELKKIISNHSKDSLGG